MAMRRGHRRLTEILPDPRPFRKNKSLTACLFALQCMDMYDCDVAYVDPLKANRCELLIHLAVLYHRVVELNHAHAEVLGPAYVMHNGPVDIRRIDGDDVEACLVLVLTHKVLRAVLLACLVCVVLVNLCCGYALCCDLGEAHVVPVCLAKGVDCRGDMILSQDRKAR